MTSAELDWCLERLSSGDEGGVDVFADDDGEELKDADDKGFNRDSTVGCDCSSCGILLRGIAREDEVEVCGDLDGGSVEDVMTDDEFQSSK